MFFSVVIPTHQRLSQLKELLTSLKEQSFKDFEVWVVPTKDDPAFELQNEDWGFPIHFDSIPDDPTGGKSASLKRNHGASKAHGLWIAFVDDDCVASPGWLRGAKASIEQSEIQFLEGGVHIPPPQKMTFPYKGILRLTRPGGFQTCNMFYKKQDFDQIGGFDPNFPYYLEDTDLAWSFQESGKKHSFAEGAQVSHPVPAAVPKKMLDSAYRMEKLPHLYKKAPLKF